MVMVAGAKELSKEPNGAWYHLSWKPTMADDCSQTIKLESPARTKSFLDASCWIIIHFANQASSRFFSKESWDDAVSGKTVFVKFFAPWSPGRKGPKVMVEGLLNVEHTLCWKHLSTTLLDILIYFRVAMNDARFLFAKTGVVTARRWSPYLGAVSLRVIKFQTRTSVNLSANDFHNTDHESSIYWNLLNMTMSVLRIGTSWWRSSKAPPTSWLRMWIALGAARASDLLQRMGRRKTWW